MKKLGILWLEVFEKRKRASIAIVCVAGDSGSEMEGKMLKKLCLSLVFLIVAGFIFVLPYRALAFDLPINQVVNSKKIWTVKFTKEVIMDDVTKKAITVKDSSNNLIKVTFEFGENKKTLRINPPIEGYISGEKYTLNLSQDVHCKSKNLPKAISIPFAISDDTIPKLPNINNPDYAISTLGTFGPNDIAKTTIINGNVSINYGSGLATDSITLQNLNINGTLTVDLGEGNLKLNNVKAKNVTISNVGSHSADVEGNSFIDLLNVNDKNNDAHILVGENASIASTIVHTGASLQIAAGATNAHPFGSVMISPTTTSSAVTFAGGTFSSVANDRPANVEVAAGATLQGVTASSALTISGSGGIGDLTVATPQTAVYLPSASAGIVFIAPEAINSRVVIPAGGSVGTLNANAPVAVTGPGTIGTANLGVSGTTLERRPTNIGVVSGVTATVCGQVVNSGNATEIKSVPKDATPAIPVVTPPYNGGGSVNIAVTGITVTEATNATTVVNGGTLQMSAAVAPRNATNQTITWSVAPLDGGSATINSATGLLSATGVGTVRVTATNAVSGVTGTKDITVNIAMPTHLAASARFTDGDTHAGKISGDITWVKAADETDVVSYEVYYLQADGTTKGGQIGGTIAKSATPDDLKVTIDADTDIPTSMTKIGVYSKNDSGLSTAATVIAITDDTSFVAIPTHLAASASFTDRDTHTGKISGDITWVKAADETDVVGYEVYYLQADGTTKGAQIGGTIAKSATPDDLKVTIDADTDIPTSMTKIGVYSKNASGLSAAATVIAITDDTSFVAIPTHLAASASFTDGDTHTGKISGDITWVKAADETDVVSYEVYYLQADGMTKGLKIGETTDKSDTPSYLKVTIAAGTDIPSGMTKIGVFSKNTVGLSTTATMIDLIEVAGDYKFNLNTGTILGYNNKNYNGEIIIPNSIDGENVTSIGPWTFNVCSGLARITIPENVTTIGQCAFRNCSVLTSITIPENVTSIGPEAFINCSMLTSITIPKNVTTIEYGTFHSCKGLTSITIGENVTSIGQEAFRDCSMLTSITIPENVTTIGPEAFEGCKGLTSITIGKNVTSIGPLAFYDCSGPLTKVSIGNKVTVDIRTFPGDFKTIYNGVAGTYTLSGSHWTIAE